MTLKIHQLITLSLLTASITTTHASLSEGDTFGDWKAVCGDIDGNSICALEQELSNETNQSVARISIVRSNSGDIVASVKVPLLVNLQAGLGLAVDGNMIARTKFFSCDEEGCLSLVKLDEDKLQSMRKGSNLTLGVYLADKEQNLTASLKGITKGLKNL